MGDSALLPTMEPGTWVAGEDCARVERFGDAGNGRHELYRSLRHSGAEVKMMIMTGYPLEDGGRQLLEEGSMARLHKPFSFQELADKVHHTLQSEQ